MSTDMNLPTPEGRTAGVVRLVNDWDGLALAWGETPTAPAGLTVGQPIQLFRIGPLFSRFTGEQIDDITDEKLAEMVRVFAATRAEGTPVPLDWGHRSMAGETPERGGLLGEWIGVEHVQGVGLWGIPAYSDRGAATVRENPGLLRSSPEFTTEGVYSKRTGARLGTYGLLAGALTPRPVQDGLATVAYSEHTEVTVAVSRDTSTHPATSRNGGAMQDEQAAPANPGADAIDQRLKALEEENAALKAKLAERDAAAAQATVALSEAQGKIAAFSETQTKVAEIEKSLQAERDARIKAERGRVIDGLLSSHRIDATEVEAAAEVLAYSETVETAKPAGKRLFDTLYASRPAGAKVPIGEDGHGARRESPAPTGLSAADAAIRAYCETNKLDAVKDYPQAYDAVKRANPALFAVTQ